MSDRSEFEAPEESALEELCGGLRYAGTRRLERDERNTLRRAKCRYIAVGMGLGIFAIIVLFAILMLMMALPEKGIESHMKLCVFLFLGVPIAVVVGAFSFLERAEPLRAIDKDNRVRVYRGRLNLSDPTDPTIHSLGRYGLLRDIEPEAEVSLELPVHAEWIYRFNESLVREPVPVYMTRAVPRPSNPIVLDAPAKWFDGNAGTGIERRRLSLQEEAELRSYLGGGWRSWLAAFVGCCVFAMALWLLLTYLTAQPEGAVPVSLVIAALLTLTGVHRRRRMNRIIRRDADLAWVIIPSTKDNPEAPLIEWLPSTGLAWTINGRPAGWRKCATNPGTDVIRTEQ